jgi:tRNA (guanine37-N1)-methyltransferase
MKVGIITLFPDMFDTIRYGVIGRAITNRLVNLDYWNPRDFATDKHKGVDDRPYGGGPGMLMQVEPLQKAIDAAKAQLGENTPVIYVSPQGKRFDQAAAARFMRQESMIFLAGRYKGIDERLIEAEVTEEWSIGDYVLSGGELPIMVMLDSIIRLLPQVLGDESSAKQDSFFDGLLDCPHYTRPEIINGEKVPDVLLSGDHDAIRRFRLKEALGRTYLRRPDLLKQRGVSGFEEMLLAEFINEYQEKNS